ncbi:hypothetical protein FQN54_001259 [Arachnomyces sp. PD_36]|nr:hypothetical protein FQN54_001259 [Arachnomyces sp. PD_36]
MGDGTQVVAKLPNPNAGAAHFTTASEVATMEFMREVLKTPTPKVYEWSSRAEDSAVGAEYVIMEKIAGVPLEDVWARLEIADRFKIVKTIARYQKSWMSTSFNQFGSLYYRKDLEGCDREAPLYVDQNGAVVTSKRFAVGPSTGREFFDDGRASIEFNRGPWPYLETYLSAIGNREINCVKNLSQLPKSPVGLYGPGTYQPTREKKLEAIQAYLKVFKYLCPIDPSITSPCLWHDDLHVGNILVNPDIPTEVVGIIDWQSTELAPLFYHARQPHLLDYDGPLVEGLDRPTEPRNMDHLGPDEQRAAWMLYYKRSLSALYKALINKQIPRLYHALEYQSSPGFNFLLLARNLLIDGEATYLAQVVELEKSWADLPGVIAHGRPPFPFSFSDEEAAKIESDMNGALSGMNAMQSIKDSLGDMFPEQGIVRPEQYEEAKDALRQAKEFILETFASNESERQAWEEAWPFDN